VTESIFFKSLSAELIPLEIEGAFASPPIPEGFDPNAAGSAELARYGLFGRPADHHPAAEAWRELRSGSRAAGNRPQLELQPGKTHLLRRPENRSDAADNAVFNNNWAGGVVVSSSGAPAPASDSWIDGYATSFNRQQHVNFIAKNGHIYELLYNFRWTYKDLTQATGAPAVAAGSRLNGYVTGYDNQQHVNYVGIDGHVHELWFDNNWHHNDLTQAAGGPVAVAGSSLDGYATSYDKQQHVNFIGTDGHVHELFFDGAWHHNDLTQAAGAPPAGVGARLDGYETAFNRQQHVNFIGPDGHVHELFFDGSWHHSDLTQATGAPAAAAGSVVDGYPTGFNNQQHVNYIGSDGHVHELFFDKSWHHNDLTQAAGAPPAASGGGLDGYATSYDNQQHVNFVGTDGHIHELWFDNAWHHNDLTVATKAPLAWPGSRIDGYETAYDRQQHVNFIGSDGHVHELWFNGSWNQNDLTANASIPWISASGTWTVPTVSRPNQQQGSEGGWNSSSWVGIDGYISNDVLQAGIQQHITSAGIVEYVAWFEWYAPPQSGSPGYIHQTNISNFPVKPGDTIFCQVTYVNGLAAGNILLVNRTQGSQYSITLAPPPGAAFSGNTIEWIMEAPDNGEPKSALPQFTPISFNPAFGADLNGNAGNPQNGLAKDIQIVNAILTDVVLGNNRVDIAFLAWHDNDLTHAAAAPPVAAGTRLDGYETAYDKQQHVNYIGTDNHVHELYYDTKWRHNDLTVAAGAPPAAGSALDGYATPYDKEQHVNYVGADGHVHELYYNGSWHHNDLTQAAGAPQAAAASSLDGYVTSYDSLQHVNYVGADGHVHELYYNGTWHHNDLTQAAAAPPVASGSGLNGYETVFNKQQHVNYVGTDGHVHELFFNGSWRHNDLTKAAGAPAAAAGTALHGYATDYDDQQHVNFIGVDGHVHELWYDSSWHHNDLTSAAGAPLAAIGSGPGGYATAFDKQQHVAYVGSDEHVHELRYADGKWLHTDLTRNGNAPAVTVGTALDAYVTSFNSQQHVNYIANDGHVHELYC
jgi:hypothetical protein